MAGATDVGTTEWNGSVDPADFGVWFPNGSFGAFLHAPARPPEPDVASQRIVDVAHARIAAIATSEVVAGPVVSWLASCCLVSVVIVAPRTAVAGIIQAVAIRWGADVSDRNRAGSFQTAGDIETIATVAGVALCVGKTGRTKRHTLSRACIAFILTSLCRDPLAHWTHIAATKGLEFKDLAICTAVVFGGGDDF